MKKTLFCRKSLKSGFTLIELLAVIEQYYSNLKPHSCFTHKNITLFLKEKGSARGKENFFSREKKFACPLASHAFTLIELLVVIAIIAILAAMLMPALNSARERGHAITCVNNLKEITGAALRYSDDYHDFILPQSYWVSGDAGYEGSIYWAGMLLYKRYLPTGSCAQGVLDPDTIKSYVHKGLYDCPSENKTIPGKTVWNSWKGSEYGMSPWIGKDPDGTDSMKRYFRKFTEIQKMHSTVAFLGDKPIDTADNAARNTAFMQTQQGLIDSARHNGRMNVSFIDGHVESIQHVRIPHSGMTDYSLYSFWGFRMDYHKWKTLGSK